MTAINDVTTLEKEGGIAVVTLNSPPDRPPRTGPI
jgi:hypothetical protein